MKNDESRQKVLVPIVIPSYEPDDRLITLLHDLDAKEMGPVIIVNDGSSTEYDPIFKNAEAIISKRGGKFISYQPNRGKGHALKTAFSYIIENMADAKGCVTADSDGQHTPECIANITDKLVEQPENLILGVRQFKKEDIPWKSWYGNKITVLVFSYIAGNKISDTQSGLRGIPLDFMKELIDVKGERFEFEMQMLIECTGKYNISEIPIKTVYDSKDNHQTHFRPFADSFRIYKILGKKFFKYIFSSLSSFVVDIVLYHLFCLLFADMFPMASLSITDVGMGVFMATVSARVISAMYNYIINYMFVFKSRASKVSSLTKYALLAIIQMCVSAGIVSLIAFLFHLETTTLVKAIVDMMLFFLSYTIQQKLVFKKK